MISFSPKQQAILDLLLSDKGGATADELVIKIGITKTAIKAHLNYLLDSGYLIFEDQIASVGRPRRRYFLSEQATEAFPKQYSWLSTQLLEQLSATLSSAELVKFMKELADRVYRENQASLEHVDQEQRLHKLAQLMNTLGYKSKLKIQKSSNQVTIEAFNCVYHNVAKAHPELCQFDVQLIRKSSRMQTTLESCIVKGGSSCRFCLK